MNATSPGTGSHLPVALSAAWPVLTLFTALMALSACKSPSPAASARSPKSPAVATPADPIVASVDLSDVHLSQVRARVGARAGTASPQQLAAALLLAVSDTLVLRELAVLNHHPRPDEAAHEAAERFLAGIWSADNGCPNLSEDALRMAWMQSRTNLHHPSRLTIWEGQFVCCRSPADCQPAPASACKARLHPVAERLRRQIDRELPGATGLAADVTSIALDDSPLPASHGVIVESGIAELAAEATELRLRRYTFHRQNEPGFAGARLTPTEPEVEAAASAAALGAALGPIETVWGWSVFVLVAREAAQRAAFEDPAVRSLLRRQVCSGAVQAERLEYRKRLLAGARLDWRRPAIAAAFGADVVAALAPDASARVAPHVPGI